MREMVEDIEFIEPTEFIDGNLKLELVEKVPADHKNGFLPVYRFKMMNRINGIEMGGINFRVGYTENVKLFRGNIGFTVYADYRGDHLALRSCKLLKPLIIHHSIIPVWLTCNPDNAASKRTIELLGAKFVEKTIMPETFPYLEYYPQHARKKLRYEWRF